MAHFNAETLIIPQCETVGALESIEEIAALDGVDGIFVGPFDLSISMEMPGDFSNPVFQAAIDRIIKACRKAGKKCIFFTGTVEGIAAGFDGMAYSLDAAIFIEALRERVDKARQLSK